MKEHKFKIELNKVEHKRKMLNNAKDKLKKLEMMFVFIENLETLRVEFQ